MEFRDYLRILRRHLPFIVVVGGLTFALLYWWQQQRVVPLYEASVEVSIEETYLPLPGTDFWQFPKQRATRLSQLRSRECVQKALVLLQGEDLSLWPGAVRADGTIAPAAYRDFLSSVRADTAPDSDLLRISFRHPDAEKARRTVNALARAFQEVALETTIAGIERQKEFLRQARVTEEERLDELMRKALELRIPPEIEQARMRIEEMRRERAQLAERARKERELREELQRRAEALSERLRSAQFLVSDGPSPEVQRWSQIVAEAESALAQMALTHRPEHPSVADARARLEEAQRRLRDALEMDRRRRDAETREQLVRELEDLQREIRDRTSAEDEIAGKITEVDHALVEAERAVAAFRDPHELERRAVESAIESQRQLITTIESQTLQLEQQKQYIGEGPVKIIHRAEDAVSVAAFDLRRSILFSAVLALVVALAGAYALELLDTTVRTESDVKRYVNLPLYGGIPLIRKEADRLLVNVPPRSPLSEAFNTIGTLIETYQKENDARVIMLTSSKAEEGKSTILANLAVALARGGRRVVLVDADLRKGVLHRFLGVDNSTGLAPLLAGEVERAEDAFRPTGVEGLTLLPSGPHPKNPVLLLKNGRMRDLVRELAAKFDVVLTDVPPVSVAVDTLVLAPLMDAVLFLVSAGETRKDEVAHSKRLLESSNARLVGCVLNKITIHSRGYYYYYYYQYYYDRYKYYRES